MSSLANHDELANPLRLASEEMVTETKHSPAPSYVVHVDSHEENQVVEWAVKQSKGESMFRQSSMVVVHDG